jgi:hypothetical protein
VAAAAALARQIAKEGKLKVEVDEEMMKRED